MFLFSLETQLTCVFRCAELCNVMVLAFAIFDGNLPPSNPNHALLSPSWSSNQHQTLASPRQYQYQRESPFTIVLLAIMINITTTIWSAGSAGSAGLPRWQVCTLGEQSAPDCWHASHINSIADTIIIFIITTIAINIISTSSTIGTITKITHSLFCTWGQQPDCSEGRDFLAPFPWSSPSPY